MDGLAMKPKGPRATEQRAREWAARSTDPPLPDWLQIRDYQLDAVERVVKEYEAGARVVFLDAPTGTGKTAIAEMVRRRLEVARGLYVCTTKSLQDQVARDFPYARVLKGRANYTPTKLSARERDGYRQGARGGGGSDLLVLLRGGGVPIQDSKEAGRGRASRGAQHQLSAESSQRGDQRHQVRVRSP
jgi:Rad3-related DNA helicase